MNLAAILLFAMLFPAMSLRSAAALAQQIDTNSSSSSASQDQSKQDRNKQDRNKKDQNKKDQSKKDKNKPASSPSRSSPSQSSPSQSKSASVTTSKSKAKPARRKKPTSQNCSASELNAANAAQKDCPPPKVVVKNGGSEQPTVQLKSTPKEAEERSTTEQINAATEDNLKKIADQDSAASRQEVVNQIKQFLEQSKAAVAEGDLERGRNLAMKARLLSDEFVKP